MFACMKFSQQHSNKQIIIIIKTGLMCLNDLYGCIQVTFKLNATLKMKNIVNTVILSMVA